MRFKPPPEGRPLGTAAGGVVPASQVFTYSDFVGSQDSRYLARSRLPAFSDLPGPSLPARSNILVVVLDGGFAWSGDPHTLPLALATH